jgi:hypothetical protein
VLLVSVDFEHWTQPVICLVSWEGAKADNSTVLVMMNRSIHLGIGMNLWGRLMHALAS